MMSQLKALALKAYRAATTRIERSLDHRYLASDVPGPVLTGHTEWREYIIARANHPGLRVLEIGAREVTGAYGMRERLNQATYVGFDYHPGPNVDVVGDVHNLSRHFDQPFDVIYCAAVFEHLAMPWRAAEEIAKVLKVGGTVLVETHFSYASHERPWHFFQFSDMGLKVLFCEALGFECLEASMQNPIIGRFSSLADPYLRGAPVAGLYCHSSFLGRKVRDVQGFSWDQVDIAEVVSHTHYPL